MPAATDPRRRGGRRREVAENPRSASVRLRAAERITTTKDRRDGQMATVSRSAALGCHQGATAARLTAPAPPGHAGRSRPAWCCSPPGFVAVLLPHTSMATGAFTVSRLRDRADELSDTRTALQRAVDAQSALPNWPSGRSTSGWSRRRVRAFPGDQRWPGPGVAEPAAADTGLWWRLRPDRPEQQHQHHFGNTCSWRRQATAAGPGAAPPVPESGTTVTTEGTVTRTTVTMVRGDVVESTVTSVDSATGATTSTTSLHAHPRGHRPHPNRHYAQPAPPAPTNWIDLGSQTVTTQTPRALAVVVRRPHAVDRVGDQPGPRAAALRVAPLARCRAHGLPRARDRPRPGGRATPRRPAAAKTTAKGRPSPRAHATGGVVRADRGAHLGGGPQRPGDLSAWCPHTVGWTLLVVVAFVLSIFAVNWSGSRALTPAVAARARKQRTATVAIPALRGRSCPPTNSVLASQERITVVADLTAICTYRDQEEQNATTPVRGRRWSKAALPWPLSWARTRPSREKPHRHGPLSDPRERAGNSPHLAQDRRPAHASPGSTRTRHLAADVVRAPGPIRTGPGSRLPGSSPTRQQGASGCRAVDGLHAAGTVGGQVEHETAATGEVIRRPARPARPSSGTDVRPTINSGLQWACPERPRPEDGQTNALSGNGRGDEREPVTCWLSRHPTYDPTTSGRAKGSLTNRVGEPEPA